MRTKIMLIGALLFVWSVSCLGSKTVNILDYGASSGGSDCVQALQKALEECRHYPGSTLFFPKGDYHFYPDYGKDKYVFVSNNDEGLKRVIFLLEDFRELTIEGDGSQFVFHGFVNPFIVEHSSNIRLRNFSVDCSRSFHSESIILSNHARGIDIEIPENYPYRISNGVLLFTDGQREEQRKTTVSKVSVYPYGSLLEYDPVKKETAYMVHDYYLDGNPLPADSLGGRRVRIYLDGLTGTPGNVMTFAPSHRNYPGFILTDSRNIKFEEVTIYHSGGMGIVGQRTDNVSVLRCRVTPSEGRLVSCTADATHFSNCTGKIELGNNLFENQKDDATNIHGIYVQIVAVEAPDIVVTELKHSQQFGFDFLKEGKEIEIVGGKSLITKSRNKVLEAERINKSLTRIKLTEPLPVGTGMGDAIAEIRAYPEIHIYGNTIRRNRARGMLLNCRGKTVVENNYFHNPGAAILFEGDASFWFEQGGVSDCVIRNNIFDNCLYGVWGEAVIDVPAGIHEEHEKSRYNKNIRITDNTFRTFDKGLLLHAYGVDGLVWKNNKIERTTDYSPVRTYESPFKISDSDHINIQE